MIGANLVFSAAEGADGRQLFDCGVQNIMVNFNHPRASERVAEKVWSQKPKATTLFADSGAFTLWHKAYKEMTERENREYVQRYAKWAIDYNAKFAGIFRNIYFVTFDKIPGVYGSEPTQQEIRKAEKVSMENFLRLRDLGVPNLIPVVHQHERADLVWEYEALQGENAYICFSPANDQDSASKAQWLKEVFAIKKPTTRVHALGVFSEELVMQFPWESADATSWFVHVNNHIALIWDFGRTQKIAVGRGYKRLLDHQRLGFKRTILLNDTRQAKVRRCIRYYMELEAKAKRFWNRSAI